MDYGTRVMPYLQVSSLWGFCGSHPHRFCSLPAGRCSLSARTPPQGLQKHLPRSCLLLQEASEGRWNIWPKGLFLQGHRAGMWQEQGTGWVGTQLLARQLRAPHMAWLHTGILKGMWLAPPAKQSPLGASQVTLCNLEHGEHCHPASCGVLPHWGCWFGPGVVAWIPHTGHSKEGDVWGVKVSGSVECNLGESPNPGQSWTTREQPDLSAHPTEKGNGGQRWDSANPSWTGSGSEESQGGGAPG